MDLNLPNIHTAGDCALLVEFSQEISPETHSRVQALSYLIERKRITGVEEIVPAFCSLMVYYNPMMIRYNHLRRKIRHLSKKASAVKPLEKTVWKIPVCYGGDFGPDLPFLCHYSGLSEEEIIRIHTGTDYLIYMLGFLPGFPYLGGLDERLSAPRLENPRLQIEAGFVGIGGNQTGIYPMASPGGWRLIGRTPLRVYAPGKEPPVAYKAGDFIRFYPISHREYSEIYELEDRGMYYMEALKGDH